LETIAWWKCAPDASHKLVTAGFGTWKKADYATAALAEDGRCAVVYLPTSRKCTVDLKKLKGPVIPRWFDPTTGESKAIAGSPYPNAGSHEFAPPGNNGAGEADWVLLLTTTP
jgi:hypothetical protein